MNPYEIGTRRFRIIELHMQGYDKKGIYDICKRTVEDQVKPWIFSVRDGMGSTVPRPIDEQYVQLKYEINRTVAAYVKSMRGDKTPDVPVPHETIPVPTPKVDPLPKSDLEKDMRWFVTEMQRIRRSLDNAAGDSNAGRIDHVSYRPIDHGLEMIANGISPLNAIHAFSMHWSEETRNHHGIRQGNPLTDCDNVPDGEPMLLSYVRKLASARVPIMLVGPAGAGKSRMAESLARIDFNGRFASCPLTAGIMPSWLIGTHTVAGWSSRPFLDIYSNGGVFAFEEMDSADPNVLLIINNAIANGYLDNPNDGKRYDMHADFVAVACCNTLGMGADRFYVGRERLDFATIDRFRMGRVWVGMDNDVDTAILAGKIRKHSN